MQLRRWGRLLKNGIESPRLALDKCEEVYFRARYDEHAGVDIFAEDWDVLAILDACRYDVFEEVNELPGELRKVSSRASATDDFLRRNFSGKDLTDTVYVTGNPQFYRIQNGIYDAHPIDCRFYETRNVWQDNWDDEHRTVRPEVVTDAAIEAAQEFPNKRILVHYLQPHAPYIGPTGSEELPRDYLNFWSSFKTGEIDVELSVVRHAYRENVEIVLEDVERLLSEVEGKIVLTADHGEMLGERTGLLPTKKYGHPSGVHTPELIEVPWFVHERGSRRKTVAEEPEEKKNIDIADEEVKERLNNLGYTN
jgi:hypothetical protein